MNAQYRNFDSVKLTGTRITFEREECHDDDSTPLDWMDETEDAERIAAWRAGDFTMIGIRAKATVWVPIGGGSFTIHELTSAGLWGIESDSDADYLDSVYCEECASLLAAMRHMGMAAIVCEVFNA